LFHISALAGA